jgi:hypothetical protein
LTGKKGMGKTRLNRAAASVALLALAVWLGGLVALGAMAAPIVFAVTPFPQSADAMTLVFRRFDTVAMACAALVLASEAVRAAARAGRRPMTRGEVARIAVSALAAAAAVVEGMFISPRIAALHAGGALRGVGELGAALSRLHDAAESCGKIQVALLSLALVLHATVAERGSQVDGGSPEP